MATNAAVKAERPYVGSEENHPHKARELDVDQEVEKSFQIGSNTSLPMSTENGSKRSHSVEVRLAFVAKDQEATFRLMNHHALVSSFDINGEASQFMLIVAQRKNSKDVLGRW